MHTDEHGSERAKFVDVLTESVLGAAFEIANVLGAGFLEKVYERAFLRELALRGLDAKSQVSFPVRYKGHFIGDYMADLVLENKLIAELKCVDQLSKEHLAQCINYLKASHIRLALLINFQRPRIEWKRVVFDQ
jgi:GxxExxY protein